MLFTSLISLVLASRLASAATIVRYQSSDTAAQLASIKEAFANEGIPTSLNITFSPSILLTVIYPQADGARVVVKPGQSLQVNQTAIQPIFAITSEEPIEEDPSRYVVTMFDPDAPSPADPSLAPLRHFVGQDYVPTGPEYLDSADLVNQTEALSEYIQPAPTAGSGSHRYTWLLWKQPAGFDNQTYFTPLTIPITDPTPAQIAEVGNFDIAAFSAAVGLGQPLGGSFALIAA